MRVLYINHTAEISGGEHSLLALIKALPDSVEATIATPRGPLQAAAAELGAATTTIAGTAGSLRLHPLHTPQALGELALAGAQVRRIARRVRADLVHGNSIRSGIVLALSGLRRPPRVVHVRDCLPAGAASTATMRAIAATATTVVANSRYTARWVTATAPRARTEVVHNPVDLARWDPARVDREAARARLGVPAGRPLLGVVAQLTPWKGQDTAIEALARLSREGLDLHLLLIGSAKFVARATRFDNHRYVEDLRGMIAGQGLEDRVTFLGEREDVPELVRALDMLLAPSWEEPFGRAVIEAMAMEVPVIATNVGGPPEILEDGREGRLVAPRDPAAWAEAIAALAADPTGARQMGRAGRGRVEREFTVEHHVQAMLELYGRALSRS